MAEALAGVQRAAAPQIDKGALRTALGGVFISGLGPLLVRDSPVDAAATAFWRLVIALPAALWLARRTAPLPLKAKALAVLAGLLLAADLVLWNRAIVTTTILEASLLVMIYPLLVALGGFLIWRERITRWLGLGGALAFAGLIIMTLGPVSGQSSVSGNLYAVVAALFYSGCMLVTGRLCRAYPTIAVTAWSFVGAALGSLPAALLEDRFLAPDVHGWAYLALYGVLTLVGYLLINRSLGKLPTALVAVLGYGQPVVATTLAIPLLGEVPALGDLAGAIVVVAGLMLATRPAKVAEI
ncbi:DMT family transporter [Dongia deserti]|uniref:DMT family transporter n=1 Tax=Dongia deserti TaxID=2268030 RepID=UPI000E6537D5|nr:DMT family transporter [Dongia deserti]